MVEESAVEPNAVPRRLHGGDNPTLPVRWCSRHPWEDVNTRLWGVDACLVQAGEIDIVGLDERLNPFVEALPATLVTAE
jgi:hypothetical protein